MNLGYKQSLSEVNTILNLMGIEYISKLPNKLIKFIKENMDNSYVSNININVPINEQPIKKDAKILLSLIYRNYWCSSEKKKQLLEEDAYLKREHEKEIHEKYNPDNIFKSKQQEITTEESIVTTLSITEHKESVFMKIRKFFRKIFNIY